MNSRINTDFNIQYWNKKLRDKTPDEIIDWALKISKNKIVTTSFGIYSEILLSTITRHDPNIKVIWCDTLFNSTKTYEHSKSLITKYDLIE